MGGFITGILCLGDGVLKLSCDPEVRDAYWGERVFERLMVCFIKKDTGQCKDLALGNWVQN